MKTVNYPERKDWDLLTSRPVFDVAYLEGTIKNIMNRVKQGGDRALIELTKNFDKVELSQVKVSTEELAEAPGLLGSALKDAITTAAKNISTFHQLQVQKDISVETTPGVTCWRKALPIEKVGLYIPGGSAPLFSTVLMLAIPAKLAGCHEIVLCSPPGKNGKIHPAILFAASLSGVSKIYKAGGAQAIAAMAYGTESIPQVYKVFGPGNQFVTYAKQMISREGTAIDMPAGPSEVAVIADANSNPDFIASDLLSQAEHGPDSQVLLLTDSETLPGKVANSLKDQLKDLPRKEIAEKALENSRAIVFKNMDEVISFSNLYAPEHLIINTENADELAGRVTNAGSVFIGPYTPESAGDYASGTNHTLPTNGYARAYSGLNTESFVKHITFQKITKSGLENLGPAIELMAEAEELMAHKNAVSIRLNTNP
ncbi:MAG: histidinol dehydrogenase [Cyclobacteriaceae bacterium]|nr:histidinol dehydrogenase [Cyclobacteriaceae bacterium]